MSDDSCKIGIFVVAYNAESTLNRVLARIPEKVWQKVSEVFVFDDSSTDSTVESVLSQPNRWSDKVSIYRNNVNLGYGGNQKRGYLYAQENNFDIVVLLHGDSQYAPEELERMIEPIEEGEADAVFGSRMMIDDAARKGGMPLYKRLGNRILTKFQNALLGSNLTEFHSGYRAYRVSALEQLPLAHNTNDFHFDTQIIIQLLDAGYRIKEIPIPVYYGDEICRVNGMQYARNVVLSTLRYRLHSTGLVNYPEYQVLPQETKYTFKQNRFSSHSQILNQLGELDNNSHILDIGSGAGFLSKKIRDRGAQVYGVDATELGEEHRQNFTKFVQRNIDEGLNLDEEYRGFFDVIVCADILEHLDSPKDVLKDAMQYLKPNGKIIASTGNVAHVYIRLMLLIGRFDYTEKGILDKTHKILFTKKTFARLFHSVGYRVTERAYTPIPFENIFMNQKVANTLCYLYMGFVRVLSGLFAYQFVYTVEEDEQFRLEEERKAEIYSPYIEESNHAN